MRCIYLLMPLFLLACTDSEPSSTTTVSQPDSTHTASDIIQSDNTISLEAFTSVPSAIDGCSGLFTLEGDSTTKAYIFVSNLQTKAFVQINGALLELRRDTSVAGDSARMRHQYRGNGLEVEVNTTEQRRLGDELWQYKGDLIIRKDQQERTYRIVGEVGC